MDIEGYVDLEADTMSIKHSRFDDLLKEPRYKKLVKRDPTITLADVTIKESDYERYLWRAYKAAPFEKEKGMLGLTKKLKPEEMKGLMIENIEVTEDDLRLLASARAEAVKDYILSTEKVEPERIFVAWPDSLTPEEKKDLKPSRVEFRLK